MTLSSQLGKTPAASLDLELQSDLVLVRQWPTTLSKRWRPAAQSSYGASLVTRSVLDLSARTAAAK